MADRRHTAEVTSDRLAADVERWHEHFTPQERDAVALVRRRLQDIADDERQVALDAIDRRNHG